MLARSAPLLLLALASPALAVDVPVEGTRLVLRSADGRGPGGALALLRDAAIQPGAVDPTASGASLVLDAGASVPGCRTEASLPGSGWRRGGQGRAGAFRYHDPTASVHGIRSVALRPGAIEVVAAGKHFPCVLPPELTEPLRVELAAGDTRWCAAFEVAATPRGPGALVAGRAPPPEACGAAAPVPVTAASLNILHGFNCPASTGFCRFDERLALLFQWIELEGCPDVVALQEVSIAQAPSIEAGLPTLCGGAYTSVYRGDNFFDDEMHLVRHPVLAVEEMPLLAGFRTVLFTRLDHPVGPLDVFSTHLASGSDNGGTPCGVNCPAECASAGAATIRDCQAVQLALFVESRHDAPGPALVMGDFNEVPDSFVYQQLAGRGWLDAYLAAGLPECDPATGEGCTSGREDGNLSELESPASNQTRRIDWLFVVPPMVGVCEVDPGFTRIFVDEPNPFAGSCGAAPEAICWVSDHEGMQVGLGCR